MSSIYREIQQLGEQTPTNSVPKVNELTLRDLSYWLKSRRWC